MNVAQYTFQSPSSSQVQVGRLDPSSVKEEKTQEESNSSTSAKTNEVNPALESQRLLDIYA